MDAADIRDLSNDEILDQIVQAKEELFRLRFRSATQQLENSALIKGLRRDIARMKTILRERELSNGACLTAPRSTSSANTGSRSVATRSTGSP